MKHKTNAYKDGYKWIIFCTVCGVEEPDLNLNGECSGELRLKKQEELFGRHEVVGNSQTGKN